MTSRTWLLTALVAAVIVYGSLYPFEFHAPTGGIGPLAYLLTTVSNRPGRGDAVANVLLYMPLGFFFLLGARDARRQRLLLVLAVAAGGLLSLAMELLQFYDAGRDTNFDDLVANTLGTLLGALAAIIVGARLRLPLMGEVAARPVPALLIAAWLGYRLYPYVPTIDLHKYWNALKPIVLTPSLTGYDLFRQTVIWLTVYTLIGTIVRRQRAAWVAPLFSMGVLGAEVLIVDTVVRLAEPIGAALAFGIWLVLLLLPSRLEAGAVALVLCGYVVALRLEPFAFAPVSHGFGWIPFLSFMFGSLRVDTLAFLEKFFLYGSMIYLLGIALVRRLPAALLIAGLLFATSWAESWLPGRSAEITDALMALIVATVFALLPAETDAGPVPRRLTPHERQVREWQREQARALGVKIDRL